uniref:Uncharacterized protein n=1 Tax=Caenorhabditis japonica TaxID=281687 RepID=A0A8R1I9E7_CAEJA
MRVEYRFGGFGAVGRCPILLKSEWSLTKVASNPEKQDTLQSRILVKLRVDLHISINEDQWSFTFSCQTCPDDNGFWK